MGDLTKRERRILKWLAGGHWDKAGWNGTETLTMIRRRPVRTRIAIAEPMLRDMQRRGLIGAGLIITDAGLQVLQEGSDA